MILKSYTEKWYANSTIIEYKGKKLVLKIRNNPLAEYVLYDVNKEILAYRLETVSGKAEVKIKSNTSDYMFDYLLWYVFLPIAQENIGYNYDFIMLLS